MPENQKMKHESVKIRDGVEKTTAPEKQDLESHSSQVIPNSVMLSMAVVAQYCISRFLSCLSGIISL